MKCSTKLTPHDAISMRLSPQMQRHGRSNFNKEMSFEINKHQNNFMARQCDGAIGDEFMTIYHTLADYFLIVLINLVSNSGYS